MTEEDKKEFEAFFKEMQKEQKELLSKKEYHIRLKESVEHITYVIRNQATSEQLIEYKKIDNRVQKVLENIDDIIKDIMSTEKTLKDIQETLEEILKTDSEITLTQTTFLQNQISRFNDKKEEIERQIQNNQVGFVLKELNYFSEKIKLNSESTMQEVEFNVKNKDELLDKIRQSMYSSDNEKQPTEETNENTNAESQINTRQAEMQQNNEEIIKEDKNTNVLIISEKDKLVHLPYKQSDINYLLNTRKFKSKEEIIKKVYTVPLSRYSNYTVSRLTEGFKLMREREKAPLGESLKYACSLIWERLLHPAIISACRTQDDLDIYLACLEDNMLPLFDSFEIRFEYRPMKVRQSNKLEYFEQV